jgi:NADH-quinone oxidoreductase subunit N
LPEPVRLTLWAMAALTMVIGNAMALVQQSVKRMLAYSSVAHSGYMVVGLIVGPGGVNAPVAHNGLAAVLFYMLCYGFMNLGAFAVLACVEKKHRAGGGEEIETVDDLRGLCSTHPVLGWTMVLSAASLLGLPPLLGFFGKFFLFTSAIAAGEIALVVVMGVASAIAAFYYLRLVAAPLLEDADERGKSYVMTTMGARIFAAVASAASVVALVPAVSNLMRMSDAAIKGFAEPEAAEADPVAPAVTEAAGGMPAASAKNPS